MCNDLPNNYLFCVMIVQTFHSMFKSIKTLPTCPDVMHQLWLNQELWPYFGVKLLYILRCFLTNLPDWQEFYTTAGRAKYQFWGGGMFLIGEYPINQVGYYVWTTGITWVISKGNSLREYILVCIWGNTSDLLFAE